MLTRTSKLREVRDIITHFHNMNVSSNVTLSCLLPAQEPELEIASEDTNQLAENVRG
jgi:hypothetical protein